MSTINDIIAWTMKIEEEEVFLLVVQSHAASEVATFVTGYVVTAVATINQIKDQ